MEHFDTIYSTELVFVKDCYQLCGDAHCCHFSRYVKRPTHELLLMPGEWDYLEERGYLDQYARSRRQTRRIDLSCGGFDVEKMKVGSDEPNTCPCRHDIRPTVCRLYPALPIFSLHDGVVGIDPDFTTFEVFERIHGLKPVCAVREVPFDQFSAFGKVADALWQDPKCRFQIMAYRLAKEHVVAAVKKKSGGKQASESDGQELSPEQAKEKFRSFSMSIMPAFDAELLEKLDVLARRFLAEVPGFSMLPPAS